MNSGSGSGSGSDSSSSSSRYNRIWCYNAIKNKTNNIRLIIIVIIKNNTTGGDFVTHGDVEAVVVKDDNDW